MNKSGSKSRSEQMLRKAASVLPKGIVGNLAHWWSGSAHEADFLVFDWLRDLPGLVLDVGANRGHSALSVLTRTRKMKVCSIEPNPDQRSNLNLIRLLYPFRFGFHMLGAGEKAEELILNIPGSKNSGLSSQSSLKHEEFDKPHIRQRLASQGMDVDDESAFRKVSVKVIELDTLELQPDLIKMDVEGFEAQALRGLDLTVQRFLPALLIEVNEPEARWPQLEGLGYGFYYFDDEKQALFECDIHKRPLNLFCLHQASTSPLSRQLLKRVEIIT
jgi:FkbM family methyltransferase